MQTQQAIVPVLAGWGVYKQEITSSLQGPRFGKMESRLGETWLIKNVLLWTFSV